jgi:SulP family sulfate permease
MRFCIKSGSTKMPTSSASAAANATAAVSGAFVVNGSPTQTATADRADARSQLAQLAFSGIVLIILLFLTGPLQYLPRCVLASIVFTIAVGMVDIKGLRSILQESPDEFMLATATAVAVVAVGWARSPGQDRQATEMSCYPVA